MRGDLPVVRLVLAALLSQACGGNPANEGGGDGAAGSTGDDGGAEAADASVDVDAGAEAGNAGPDGATVSRCQLSSTSITCQHQLLTLQGRTVAYETPFGVGPAGGWPGVVYFQGSFVPGDGAFAATVSAPFGQYDLTRTIVALLDHGYAVIAPDASSGGASFWETNVPPYAGAWSGCPDDVLMQSLFAAIAGGQFGPIDGTRLYAMGISSGGFMTSRMAVSYQGKFRALVDHSGSYATCSATCTVPTPLPTAHPPTLFLHGDGDTVVPMSAIQPYVDALTAEGHEAKLVTDADAGHQWLPEGPQVIPAWFDAHP